ncbi:hypothetical protein Bca4012_065502 [Brassica carinata]
MSSSGRKCVLIWNSKDIQHLSGNEFFGSQLLIFKTRSRASTFLSRGYWMKGKEH